MIFNNLISKIDEVVGKITVLALKKEIKKIDSIPHRERDYGFKSYIIETEIDDKFFSIQLIVNTNSTSNPEYILNINNKHYSLKDLFNQRGNKKIQKILSDILPKLLDGRRKKLEANEKKEELRQKTEETKTEIIQFIEELGIEAEGYEIREDIYYERQGNPRDWDTDLGDKKIQKNIYLDGKLLTINSKTLLNAYHILKTKKDEVKRSQIQEEYADFS